MRLPRTLALLALVASLATGCGSGSSSSAAPSTDNGSAGPSNALEVRSVYAHYARGLSLGPQMPQDLMDEMSHQTCPMHPRTLQDMQMECDANKTVFLLKDPITSGDVDTAVAKEIGHGKLWFVEVTLDSSAASTLAAATKNLTGTEIAYSFQGSVLTSVIVDSSFNSDQLSIVGDYDKAQATQLADQLTSA